MMPATMEVNVLLAKLIQDMSNEFLPDKTKLEGNVLAHSIPIMNGESDNLAYLTEGYEEKTRDAFDSLTREANT